MASAACVAKRNLPRVCRHLWPFSTNGGHCCGNRQMYSVDTGRGLSAALIKQLRERAGAPKVEDTKPPQQKDQGSHWFLPKKPLSPPLPQKQEGKKTENQWFLPRKDNAAADQARQEITTKQVGARWLASSGDKFSPPQEFGSKPGFQLFGSGVDSTTSERERLEVSMQRLALMSKPGEGNIDANFMMLPPKDDLLRKYFHWDNLPSVVKHHRNLEKVRREFQMHKTDCGSSQVQIALLTFKIKYMTQHMQRHRKDVHSRKGLEAMVSQRRRLLKYLRRKDWDTYCQVISKLGLRDNLAESK